jgi:hypothetical protein
MKLLPCHEPGANKYGQNVDPVIEKFDQIVHTVMDLTVCYFPRRQTTWLKWKIKGTQVNEIHHPTNLSSFNGENDH